MKKLTINIILICLLLSINQLFAQEQNSEKKNLTYKQAFERGGEKLTGPLPSIISWFDNEHYLESKSRKDDKAGYIIKVNAKTGDTALFLDYQEINKSLPEEFNIFKHIEKTDDYKNFVLKKNGNLYHYSIDNKVLKQLTAAKSEDKNPRFSPNGKYVAFTRDHNLFAVEVESGLEHQLTDDGSDCIYNGWASWIYYEEILGRKSKHRAFWWSPNSEMIAFLRFDDSPVPKFPLYSAEGIHGELEFEHYPKAGDPNPIVKLGIAHIKTSEIKWIDIEDGKDRYIAFPQWTHDSKNCLFQVMNRGQDTIKIYFVNIESGGISEIYTEAQSSWVGFFEDIHIFKNGSGFLIRSDIDGWRHLYYYDINGKLKNRITSGKWRVNSIAKVDEENETVYFHAAKGNSTESYLYKIDLDGNNLEKLTDNTGYHSCRISPGCDYFIDTYSKINQPAKINLLSIDGKLIRELGDSRLPAYNEYNLGKAELFTIPSGDEYDLPALWLLPPDFDKSKKYPIIFSIYSGPDAKTVRNSYHTINRLSNQYLAQNGIIIIIVDNRGSGHFGKKGMAAMHRNLGKWEMHDLIAAAKWLKMQPFIDSTKIGITGGSYGGYMACLALTLGSDYFTHGIAKYSLTDWRLYDNVYTERYMDTPKENPEGYEFGSVMTHADKYHGNLFLIHGTMDDNVHMQHIIQLIDKFQDLGKDFDLMLYPNERHGFGFPKRGHMYKEEVRFWFRHFLGRELTDDSDE